MAASAESAVRSPGSVSPSSTSVIATAGRMLYHHGARGQQRGLSRDLSQHPPEERVDYLDTGDVDDHATHPGAHDGLTDVLLELLRRAVVQVPLEGDQEDVAEPEDRHVPRDGAGEVVVHRCPAPPGVALMMSAPNSCRA